MKKLLLLVLVALMALTGCMNISARSTIPKEEQEQVYQFEISKNQKDSFNLAKEWMALNFNDITRVMKLENVETGRIILKPLATYYGDKLKMSTMTVPYTLTVNCRDNFISFKYEVGTLKTGYYPSVLGMQELTITFKAMSNDIVKYISEG